MTFFFRPWYYDPLFWEIFLVDWVSKWMASEYLYRPLKMTSFFSLRFSINRGISWSLFDGHGTFVFVLITALVFAILCFLAHYALNRQKEGHNVFGETLLLAGGFSNFVDRFVYGGVVDFISLSYGSWAFPIFNFADIAITFGVGVILYQTFFGQDDE